MDPAVRQESLDTNVRSHLTVSMVLAV